jgi:hypothetical protein
MKKVLIAALFAAFSVGAAQAQIIGTQNNSNPVAQASTSSQGGAGGAGGTGISTIQSSGNSTATGGAGGLGVSTIQSSGNSTNRNSNHNSATGGNATGGAGGVGVGGSGGVADQGQNQSSANTNNVGGNNSTYTSNESRIPVATAYAPNIAPTAPCMGSTSGGVQGMSVGVSIGSTWIDHDCTRRETVRVVAEVLHDTATAESIMCNDKEYAAARAAGGRPCFSNVPAPVAASPVASVASTVSVASTEARDAANPDPFVRSRLGLPPLAK